MKAIAHFHFEVPGLLVSAELVGATFALERDADVVCLTLPSTPDDFGLKANDHLQALAGGIQRDGKWISRSITLVRMSVEFDLPDAALDESLERETDEAIERAIRSAADVARNCLRGYLDLVRTRGGQHWLGHSADMPRVAWLTTVVERETGKRIRISYNDPLTVTMIGREDALSADTHRQLIAALDRSQAAELPDLFLADATYLASRHDSPKYREAIILAAVAAELKIKECLDAACPDGARELLRFALNNPRDVSVQAVALYDKAARAVVGRSLREENHELYKALKCLFEMRNAVAHRGFEITQDEMRAGLRAAAAALAWAQQLTSGDQP